jgi:hypothetical protein
MNYPCCKYRINMANINEIFETVQKELAGMPELDIESILQTAELAEYLENRTLHDIRDERDMALEELELSEECYKNFTQKLEKYRYVNKICDIHRGKYARWIKKNVDNDPEYKPKLSFGGVVCDIKFNDNGTYLHCFSCGKYHFSLKIDNFVFFQKLTEEEWNVLTIYTYCKN